MNLRVLWIAPANSIHTIRWINSLKERGIEVYLVSLKNHREQLQQIDSTVKVIYLPFVNGKGYYLNAPAIKRIVRQIHPDVVHVHYASGYGTLARIAHLADIILSVWGSDVYQFPYRNFFNYYIIKKNLLHAKKVFSTSNCMSLQVKKLIGENHNIEITPFGVDTQKFSPNDLCDQESFDLGIAKSLSYIYGIDIVIKAFAHFRQKLIKKDDGKKSYLHIFGSGEDSLELKELCKKLNLEKDVFFYGNISHEKLAEKLQKLDVLCLGSRAESFGVILLEAMSCGLPVVSTDTEGAREIIREGENGFIVPQGDYTAMGEKLYELYSNPDLRIKVGKTARQFVLTYYDWNNNVNHMIELYENYLMNRRKND